MEILHLDTMGCYAVIFTATQTKNMDGYADAVNFLREKLRGFEGFIGLEAIEDKKGNEITVSYWKDIESIKLWKEDNDHSRIRNENRGKWYSGFKVRIVRIEREYELNDSSV